MRRVLLFTVAAFFAAGAAWSSSSSWILYKSQGVSLRYPPSWHATTTPLTHVTDPEQVVAIASYPLPTSNRGDDGCQPKGARSPSRDRCLHLRLGTPSRLRIRTTASV
jgi:hypothetical protein